MNEQQLIDVNELKNRMNNYHLQIEGYKSDNEIDLMTKVAQAMHDNAIKCINDTLIIDPETLPIVRELRAKLKQIIKERDDYKELFFSYRHVCDGVPPEKIEELIKWQNNLKLSDYIDKNKFKEKYLCCGWLPEMSEEEFDKFPTADVRPVVYGKWYFAEDCVFRCSVCDRICPELDASYCNCGAYMKEKTKEENYET